MTAIVNTNVVLPDSVLVDGFVLFGRDTIQAVGKRYEMVLPRDTEIIDAEGLYTAPGFVDIHCHAGGRHWSHENPVEMARHHLAHGTTSLICTIYRNVGFQGTLEGVRRIKRAFCEKTPGNIAGIHLEGPYLNPGLGALSGFNAPKPDPTEYMAYLEEAGDLLKQWTFSPELEGLEEFVDAVNAKGVALSIGHSNAGPEQIEKFVNIGVRIVTHLMDATGCRGPSPRYMGTREPWFDECAMIHDLYTEVIADSEGAHVRPVMLKLILKTMGADRVVLVTDACVSGEREPVGAAEDLSFANGELYGSRLSMDMACRNMIKHTGCGIVDVFRMAAKNPAEAIGVHRTVGILKEGKRANITLVDENIYIRRVILDGVTVWAEN